MSETSPITGELSNSKVAAVFPRAGQAREAARAVAAALQLGEAQVQVIAPADPQAARKLQPEARGIWRTIVVAHARLGIVGLVAGGVAFALLHASGVPFIVNSPVASALVLLFFGAIAGLMLGGLVALRPDQDRMVQATRDAQDEGNTTVVVHAFSAEQAKEAGELLRARGGEVTGTL